MYQNDPQTIDELMAAIAAEKKKKKKKKKKSGKSPERSACD